MTYNNPQEFQQWFNTQFTTEQAKVQAGGGSYKEWLRVLENPANWEKACQGKAWEYKSNNLINEVMQNTVSKWVAKKWKQEAEELKVKLAEQEETREQLRTSQEGERQKGEIIEQWKQKLQSYLTSRKETIQQEITLIKEILHD